MRALSGAASLINSGGWGFQSVSFANVVGDYGWLTSGTPTPDGPSWKIQWLVSDQLGTPRMIFDQSGSLTVTDANGNYVSGMTRHDYLPFGEELFAGTGGRTTAQGYTGDATRQKFTSYENDAETGLNFAQSRYYSNNQGRFSSPDHYNIFFEMKRGRDAEEQDWIRRAYIWEPQNWNRYTYCINNPTNLYDPSGLIWLWGTNEQEYMWVDDKDYDKDKYPTNLYTPQNNIGPNGVTFTLDSLSGSANTPENQALIGQQVYLGSDGHIHAVEPEPTYTNDTINGGPLSAGLITDSNAQVYFTLGAGFGIGPDASYTRTYGKGPVETGLFGGLTASNGLAVSESVNLLHLKNGPSREVGHGSPTAGIGVQVVVGPLQGTTPYDWEHHPDNPEGKGPLWHAGRSPY